MVEVIHHVSIAYRFALLIFCYLLRIHDSAAAEVAENVCRSDGCIEIAEKITKYMDTSILPCDDFYKFVCNKFHGNRVRMEEESLIELITSQLMKSTSSEKNKPFQKAFKLYEQCMAENVTVANTSRFLIQFIERIGGWPLVEGDKWQGKSWENVTVSLSQSGYHWGIFFRSILRIHTSDTYILLMPENLEKITNTKEVAWVADGLGAKPTEDINRTIRNVSEHFEDFKFSTKFNYKRLTIEEMIVKWPSIDWMTYFTGYFADLPNVTIHKNQSVMVNTFEVDDLVNFIARTSKEDIMNYIVLRIIEDALPYSSEILLHSYFGMKPELYYSLSARQKYCTVVSIYSLPEMVYAILRVNYIDQIQNKFKNLTDLVRNKMGELIDQAHLDNETLRIQREILSNITFKIWNADDRKIEELVEQYNDLALNEEDFLDSLWSILKFHRNSENQRIVRGYDSPKLPAFNWKKFIKDFKEMTAFWESESQRIHITVGFAVTRLFEKEFPNYLNYGRIITTLGHEIGHAFSMEEIYAFERNSTSLNETEKNVLSSKISCFKQLYDTYIEELNTTILSPHSEKEDIPDHIGFKLAHLIYKDYLELNGPERQLPNLNYTSMQMFWISSAHTACFDAPELGVVHSQTHHHSPHRFRINMPFSNNPAFAEAFKCEPGTRMNPVNKCSFW